VCVHLHVHVHGMQTCDTCIHDLCKCDLLVYIFDCFCACVHIRRSVE